MDVAAVPISADHHPPHLLYALQGWVARSDIARWRPHDQRLSSLESNDLAVSDNMGIC